MKMLNAKLARLRDELRQAYDAWIDESELAAKGSAPGGSVDTSGSSTRAKAHWFAYLSAKQRLVLAYAEPRSQAA